MRQVLNKLAYAAKVTKTHLSGSSDSATELLSTSIVNKSDSATALQRAVFKTQVWGEFVIETPLLGEHNLANIAQVLGALSRLAKDKRFSNEYLRDAKHVAASISSFKGVTRRLDLLASKGGVQIFEDFAHHPTAIREVIGGLRKALPHKRIMVAFEPVNATGRRNVLLQDFASALSYADKIFLGPSPLDLRIPEGDRMDTTALADAVNKSAHEAKASAYATNEDLLKQATSEIRQATCSCLCLQADSQASNTSWPRTFLGGLYRGKVGSPIQQVGPPNPSEAKLSTPSASAKKRFMPKINSPIDLFRTFHLYYVLRCR